MKTKRRADPPRDPAELYQQLYDNLDRRLLGPFEVLRAKFARSNLGVALQGAAVEDIDARTTGRRIRTSGGRCVGWSFCETTGVAAAKVYLRDGADPNGRIITAITLAAGESTRDSFMVSGLSFIDGLYLDVVAGSIEGAVYVGAVD